MGSFPFKLGLWISCLMVKEWALQRWEIWVFPQIPTLETVADNLLVILSHIIQLIVFYIKHFLPVAFHMVFPFCIFIDIHNTNKITQKKPPKVVRTRYSHSLHRTVSHSTLDSLFKLRKNTRKKYPAHAAIAWALFLVTLTMVCTSFFCVYIPEQAYIVLHVCLVWDGMW